MMHHNTGDVAAMGSHELVFAAQLPALGYVSFLVEAQAVVEMETSGQAVNQAGGIGTANQMAQHESVAPGSMGMPAENRPQGEADAERPSLGQSSPAAAGAEGRRGSKQDVRGSAATSRGSGDCFDGEEPPIKASEPTGRPGSWPAHVSILAGRMSQRTCADEEGEGGAGSRGVVCVTRVVAAGTGSQEVPGPEPQQPHHDSATPAAPQTQSQTLHGAAPRSGSAAPSRESGHKRRSSIPSSVRNILQVGNEFMQLDLDLDSGRLLRVAGLQEGWSTPVSLDFLFYVSSSGRDDDQPGVFVLCDVTVGMCVAC